MEETGLFASAVRWEPSSMGFYKVNVDVALLSSRDVVGLGCVIKNHLEEVMGSIVDKRLLAKMQPWDVEY